MSFYRNIKNRKLYKMISDLVINATNSADNKLMVLYKDKQGHRYVSDRDEFYQKFEKTTLNKFEN